MDKHSRTHRIKLYDLTPACRLLVRCPLGLRCRLIDVDAERSVAARQLVEKFLDFLRPALKEFGE